MKLRLVAFSGLLACNAVAGLDGDFTLHADVAPGEGGAPTGDGGSATDGGAVDAPAAMDGDTGTPRQDSGGPFDCSGTLFCWDFEKPASAPNWAWNGVLKYGPTLEVNAAAGYAGNGLHAISATNASSALYEDVSLSPSWTTQTLSLEFRFRILSANADYADIGAIEFNGREHGLAFYATDCASGSPCLNENDQQDRGHNTAGSLQYVVNTWYRAEVTLTRSGQSFGGTVSVNGTLVDSRSTGAMPNAATAPTSVRVLVGAFYPGSFHGGDVDIDDVSLRFR